MEPIAPIHAEDGFEDLHDEDLSDASAADYPLFNADDDDADTLYGLVGGEASRPKTLGIVGEDRQSSDRGSITGRGSGVTAVDDDGANVGHERQDHRPTT